MKWIATLILLFPSIAGADFYILVKQDSPRYAAAVRESSSANRLEEAQKLGAALSDIPVDAVKRIKKSEMYCIRRVLASDWMVTGRKEIDRAWHCKTVE